MALSEMTKAVVTFALPFMRSNATLLSIFRTLIDEKREISTNQLVYRISVSAMLLGKHAEAKAFIDSQLREIGERRDLAANEFRRFVDRFDIRSKGFPN